MKPNFALNLSPDGIGLLQRSGDGWLPLGEVSLDAPDFVQRMAALRRLARSVAGEQGLLSKIVIPGAQVLYAEIAAPGPSPTVRRRQIATALEGMTPYPVEDLVFDWAGRGDTVQVAVVARETLAEAESFAERYGLNPVSFVAAPEAGTFDGEPWFGPTVYAPVHIPDGMRASRDQEPVPAEALAAVRGLAVTLPDPPAYPAHLIEQTPEEVAAQFAVADTPSPEPMPEQAPPEAEAPLHAASDAAVPGADAVSETLAEPEAVPSAPTPAPDFELPPEHDATELAEAPAGFAGFTALSVAEDAPEASAQADTIGPSEIVSEPEQIAAPSPAAAVEDLPEAPETSDPTTDPAPATEQVAPESVVPEPVTEAPAASEAGSETTSETTSDAVTDGEPGPPVPEVSSAEAAVPEAVAESVVAEAVVAAGPSPDSELSAEPPETGSDRGTDKAPEAEPNARPDAEPTAEEATVETAAAEDVIPDTAGIKDSAGPLATAVLAVRGTPSDATVADKSPGAVSGRPKLGGAKRDASTSGPAPQIPVLSSGVAARDASPLAAPRPARTVLPSEKVGKDPAPANISPAMTTVFGTQQKRMQVGGKPRHLGFALLGALIVFMLVVAAWALFLNRQEAVDQPAQLQDSLTRAPVSAPEAPLTDPQGSATPETAVRSAEAGNETSQPAPQEPDQTATLAASGTPSGTAAEVSEPAVSEPAVTQPTEQSAQVQPAPSAEAASEPIPEPATTEAQNILQTPETPVTPAAPTDMTATPDSAPAAQTAQTAQAPTVEREVATSPVQAPEIPSPEIPAPEPHALAALEPTKEGSPAPGGFTLYAGRPPHSLPPRPTAIARAARAASQAAAQALVPAPAAAPATEPSAAPEPPSPTVAAAADTAPPPTAVPADPALRGKLPEPRPASILRTAAAAATAPSLADNRPVARPDPPAAPARAQPPQPATKTASIATVARQDEENKAAQRAAAEAAAAAALAAARSQEEADARAAAAAAQEDPGSAQAVEVSRRPESRPRSYQNSVQKALVAAIASDPPPAPRVAAPAPAASPTTTARLPRTSSSRSTTDAIEARLDTFDEPSTRQPINQGTTSATVASTATESNAIKLRSMNLIGLYGASNSRRALVRMPNGQYVKVAVGDALDGGRVTTIDDNALVYQKGSKLYTLPLAAGG